MLTTRWKEIKRKREWVLQKAETGGKRKPFHRDFTKSGSTFVSIDVRILCEHLLLASTRIKKQLQLTHQISCITRD